MTEFLFQIANIPMGIAELAAISNLGLTSFIVAKVFHLGERIATLEGRLTKK